jgi:glutathione S-transferase
LFEGLLTGREHLFGTFGAADCAAWPFLRYAESIEPDDDEIFHRVLHERMTLDERHPNLRAWIARVGERPRA